MSQRHYFKNKLFNLDSNNDFVKLALDLFYYQSENNEVYSTYLENLLGTNQLNRVRNKKLESLEEITFLPISFFKSHQVKTKTFEAVEIFSSSGTGSGLTSQHHVKDMSVYEESFNKAFQLFYGDPKGYCVLALLPSYLQRKGSSLIHMTQSLINQSMDEDSGFYLDDYAKLSEVLTKKHKQGSKVLLLGVTYALLDLAEQYPQRLDGITLMETGGMKGRRKEMIREEVHSILKTAFAVDQIHSEYGMTELLSQAYSLSNGTFNTPPWMKAMIRETTDPFNLAMNGKTGGLNIIDLANVDSCAFIETQDLGRVYDDGSFEVMGRFDNSEIRGCNLMVI